MLSFLGLSFPEKTKVFISCISRNRVFTTYVTISSFQGQKNQKLKPVCPVKTVKQANPVKRIKPLNLGRIKNTWLKPVEWGEKYNG